MDNHNSNAKDLELLVPELELVQIPKPKTDKEKIIDVIIKINAQIDRIKYKKKRL